MTMTRRERVHAALTFSKPDRVPRHLWDDPYIGLFQQDELKIVKDKYPPDLGGVPSSNPVEQAHNKHAATVGTYKDAWGSVWQVGERGVVGEVKEPVLADWSDLAHFQPPWDVLKGRDRDVINRACDADDRFMLSQATVRPFERLQFLRGTAKFYMDLAYGTAECNRLIEMVHNYYLEDMRWWCSTDVDGVFFMDDWGSNQSLLINPKMWRAIFKPLYKEYCDMIRAAGKFAFMHSDGHIAAIYEDLIEIGVDAVNSQLFTMDIENEVAKHKGKITFWGEIDRQYVLAFGTTEDVHSAVKRVRAALDDGSGGVIAQCCWGKGAPRENIEAVFEAWQ